MSQGWCIVEGQRSCCQLKPISSHRPKEASPLLTSVDFIDGGYEPAQEMAELPKWFVPHQPIAKRYGSAELIEKIRIRNRNHATPGLSVKAEDSIPGGMAPTA